MLHVATLYLESTALNSALYRLKTFSVSPVMVHQHLFADTGSRIGKRPGFGHLYTKYHLTVPMFVYADEIVTSEGLHYAVLITEREITPVIFEHALLSLREGQQEIDDKEILQLQQGSFAPEKASKAILKSISFAVRQQVDGYFNHSVADYNTLPTGNKWTRILSHMMKTDAVRYFRRRPVVHIDIHSPEPVAPAVIADWVGEFYQRSYDRSRETLPEKTLYPQVVPFDSGPHSPGRTVLDFILWAYSVSRRQAEASNWIRKLNLVFDGFHTDGDIFVNRYFFGDRPALALDPYPISPKVLNNENDIYLGWVSIEKYIYTLEPEDFTPDAQHLMKECLAVTERLKHYEAKLDHQIIQDMSLCYLKLFDTLPMYKDFPKVSGDPGSTVGTGEWGDALIVKYVAAYYWNPHHDFSADMQYMYIKWREDYYTQNKQHWISVVQRRNR